MGVDPVQDLVSADVLLIDNVDNYREDQEHFDRMVEEGKTLVFLELPVGEFNIGGTRIAIEKTIMGEYYFVSPHTGHPMVRDARPFDFKFWYNDQKGLVSPFLGSMIALEELWSPVLSTGKTTWVGIAGEYAAVAEMKKGKGAYRICQLQLNGRVNSNPTANVFTRRLLSQ